MDAVRRSTGDGPTVEHARERHAAGVVNTGAEPRLRALHAVRAAMILTVVVAALVNPGVDGDATRRLLLLAAGWALVALLAEGGRRRLRMTARPLIVTVFLDGVIIVSATIAGGGLDSPLFFLCFVHVISVTLLASYLDGVRIAVWDAALLQVAAAAQTTGQFGFLEPEPGQGSAAVIRAIALLAVAAVTAGASALHERELTRSRQMLELMLRTGQALTAATEARQVLGVALTAVTDEMGFRTAAVVVHRPGRRGHRAWRRRAGVTVHQAGDRVQERPGVPGHPQLVPDPEDLPFPWLAGIFRDERDVVVIPVLGRFYTGCIAAVVRRRHRRGLGQETLQALESLAGQVAQSLDRQELDGAIAEMASTDGLTGVANRHRFEAAFSELVDRARATRSPLSLLVADLDHFKAVNDTHGHQAGDQVLRSTASVLRRGRRGDDVVARYGGEEFAILLPDTALEDAVITAERIRADVAGMGGRIPVTVSVGVASTTASGHDRERLFADADRALYAAKSSGRDAVRAWTADASPDERSADADDEALEKAADDVSDRDPVG